MLDEIAKLADEALPDQEQVLLNKVLLTMSPLYQTIMEDIKLQHNILPPAAAMAGVYTMVDNARGVWKAIYQCQLKCCGFSDRQYQR